ncbi:MAG: hypothetical protein KGH72_00615 [Candidatus Micrarchaeota archaeon]|nr:hypothetical protein [Candidatus Micrarchaeota archaeon]
MQVSAKLAYVLVSTAFLIGMANATYLNIEGPVAGTLYNNGTIYLGKVAPGESFYVLASATTANSSGYLVNIGWNRLETTELPAGWSSQPSPLYQDPMKMKITVSPNAPVGNYRILIKAINVQNYSKLGNISIIAYVNVSPDVFNVKVAPTDINTGIGQPTNLYVTINNTGISDDPFVISATGLPAWNQTVSVISLHSTKNTFIYPVFVNESGTYPFKLTISASTSPEVNKTFDINLTARESLLNDYSAITQGAVLSPIVFAPAYSVMALISYIYKTYGGQLT